MLIINYVFVLAIITILLGAVNAFRVHASVKFLKKQNAVLHCSQVDDINNWPVIIIMIPVLREGEIIRRTIQTFVRINYPKIKLKVVVVTTEREFEGDFDKNKNTITIAKKQIDDLNSANQQELFHLIHYPYQQGVKADQLNYAIGQLQILLPNYFNDRTYIGVYDADSVTPENTLEMLAKDATMNNYPNIYQQPTFYFNNYKILPSNLNGLLSRSFSWLQSAFAIYHEANLFITQEGNTKKIIKTGYCVGHGMFIRWSFLKRIGLFPTPIEDTRLGHIASYLGEKIKILPAFDSADVTVGVMSQIKQASVWFTGEAFVAEDLKVAKKIMPNLSMRSIWLVMYKIYRNTVWITRAFLLYIIILVLIMTNNYIWAFFAGFSYLYLPVFIVYLNMPTIQTMTTKHYQKFYRNIFQTVGVILVVPIEFFIMSLGPLLGLFKFLAYRITRQNLYLPKTER